jgi:Dyp-type peroxidase family
MVVEERLELADIQGAVVPGFKKDHAAVIALRISDVAGCKTWLKARAADVARADEVLAFNRLFTQIRMRRGTEALAPKATWISISFSADGLSLLRSPEEITAAFDDAFLDGMFQSALGDPPPEQWTTGGTPDQVPHILVVVAADDATDLTAAVARLDATIADTGPTGGPALQSMGPPRLGSTLPGALRGHEHFGFKDGISQPAIRGLASGDPQDFVDARELAADDPNQEMFAEPGRPLVWPGQFLIGYNRQDRLDFLEPHAPFEPRVPWQRNGSYLVYRRLQQNVHAFWRFCRDGAAAAGERTGRTMTSEAFASLLVGRWPSGAPLVRTPAADDPELAAADTVNNDFLFSEATPLVTLADGTVPGSGFPPPQPDPNGRLCPFVAHIRKVNPRDDPTDTSGPRQTRTRLSLRRGIPYGPPKDPARLLEDDGVDRGLLFMSYQASIENQFEFVVKTWVNLPNSPHDSDPPAGHDPLIGQSRGARFVRLPRDPDPPDDEVPLPADPWVVMTGGGYFFTPAVSALSGALAE